MESVLLSEIVLTAGGRQLLSGVTLTIDPGQVVAIEGDRGTGKSTLLATAAGLLAPESGAVKLAGRDILGLESSSLPFVRRNIGYLPPAPPFVRYESAIENVMLAVAMRGACVAEAEHLAAGKLAELGVLELADRPMDTLSATEAHLVALARALVGPPPFIVLDEPGALLRPDDLERVVEAIFAAALRDSAAVLCASGDAAFVAELAARGASTLVLADGGLTSRSGGRKGRARSEAPNPGRALPAASGVILAFPGGKAGKREAL